MRFKKNVASACAAFFLATVSATSASANQTTPTPSPAAPETFSVIQPMVIRSYDPAVAAANGYKIVTTSDRSQTSVPVTSTAKAEAAEGAKRAASSQSTAVTQGDTVGNCGSSSLQGRKSYGDTVYFQTGFVVYGAVYEFDWRVNASGFISGNSWRTHRSGPASGIWNTEGAIGGVVGPGTARVPKNSASAAAIMKNGAVCYSQGPSFGFD